MKSSSVYKHGVDALIGGILSVFFLCCFATVPVVSAVPIQLHGLNFNTRQGPDWDPNKCKSREQIVTDMTMLKRFTNRLRILSLTDCNAGEDVLSVAKELDMQLWLGMWVAADFNVFLGEMAVLELLIIQGLIDTDTVLGITVGSEAIFRGAVTIAENIEMRDLVKDVLTDNGLGALPVSIVDIGQTYINNPSLTESVDVVYANIFPFWANVPIGQSVPSLLRDVVEIGNQAQADGKRIIIGETGWPSDGIEFGVSQLGSPQLQVAYFQNFYCRMDRELNYEYYYFTGIDNAWRQIQEPDNTIEGNWGFLQADLTIKPHFENLAFTCDHDGVEYSFAEIDWTIPGTEPVPTDEPATLAPATPTTPVTTLAPSPSPSSDIDPAACEAHPVCLDANLLGRCCPTADGVILGCCSLTPSTTTPLPSPAPTTTKATASPSASSTNMPTATPTAMPSAKAPSEDTMTTSTPTSSPTGLPTLAPSRAMTAEPTKSPTDVPSVAPISQSPTKIPTSSPTSMPTVAGEGDMPATTTMTPSLAATSSSTSATPAPALSPPPFSLRPLPGELTGASSAATSIVSSRTRMAVTTSSTFVVLLLLVR